MRNAYRFAIGVGMNLLGFFLTEGKERNFGAGDNGIDKSKYEGKYN